MGGFLRMVLVYSIGFCMTNGSFGKVNASFVDTVKAGEPIATMILTVLFLSAESVTLPVCLSLLPIVAGGGILQCPGVRHGHELQPLLRRALHLRQAPPL